MTEKLAHHTVMLVAQRPSDFVEMKRCAIALHELGWRSTLLYYGQGQVTVEEEAIFTEVQALRAKGVIADAVFMDFQRRFSSEGAARESEGAAREKKSRFWPRLRLCIKYLFPAHVRWLVWRFAKRPLNAYYVLKHFFLSAAFIALTQIYIFFHNQTRIRKIIDRFKPDAIILPEDVVGTVTAVAIKVGHDFNIPSVIVPYTIANQQEAFRSLSGQRTYQLSFLPNWVAGKIFPRWVMRQGGKALVRMPAPYILGQVLSRTSPPDPWMMNSGFANVIAVENEAMLGYYLESGIPRSKMKVVGAIYDDQLAKYARHKSEELKAVRQELGIENAKPLLLIGGCPDQSTNCPAGFEFKDMREFCIRLAHAFAPLRECYEILVRPHPNYVEMGNVMAAEGMKMTLVDTARLVPLSDLYIAFASATIRWAIASAVPTINYDVFRYDYNDFSDVAGVVNVKEFADFRTRLAELRTGSPALVQLQADIARSAPRWGQLDGQAAQRIAALIDGLCGLKHVPRTAL